MMEPTARTQHDNLYAQGGDLRSEAFHALLKLTDQPVDWAYEVWDDLVARLRHKDGHQRAIAAQLLCNLAKSDPETKMANDFVALLAMTGDDKFMTARHCLQAIWKVGVAGMQQQQLVVNGLAGRFGECSAEKNCTLIHYDIIRGLKQLYAAVQDEQVKMKTLELQVANEPGSTTWYELYTPNAKQARDFYIAFLGATADPMPSGLEYYVLRHAEEDLGGITQIDPAWGAMPAQWVNYFTVANADETVATVIEHGGKQMGSIDDSPFGRIAALMDPFGATFKVLQPPGG